MSLEMSHHYHAQDLIERLKAAEKKGLPVYQAQGPCGGCDLVIPLKEKPINVGKLIKSLEAAAVKQANAPLYPAEGPCGGCDLVHQT